MLNNPAARRVAAVAIDPPARLLLRMHVSPDAVTVVGTVGTCTAALVFFPRGEFLWGLLVIVLFVFSDLLDGTMARMAGTSGPWGNFLDATLDRVADGCMFGALVLWAMTTDNPWTVAAALTCLVGAQVISYAKARAEAVGATANVGIAERAERLMVGGAGILLTGLGVAWALPVALWILAVLVVVTILQRLVAVRRQLRPAAGDSAAGDPA